MRVKNIRKTKKKLHDAIEEFIAYKTVQKLRERTVADYQKYLEDFQGTSSDSLELDDLKGDLLRYFLAITARKTKI